jgi:hypothetical protein
LYISLIHLTAFTGGNALSRSPVKGPTAPCEAALLCFVDRPSVSLKSPY